MKNFFSNEGKADFLKCKVPSGEIKIAIIQGKNKTDKRAEIKFDFRTRLKDVFDITMNIYNNGIEGYLKPRCNVSIKTTDRAVTINESFTFEKFERWYYEYLA